MEAYLSPLTGADETVERISIEGTVGIFRKDVDVYAEVEGEEIKLGIRDATVSRRQNGLAPVEFIPQSTGIEIQNNGNTNEVSVDTGIETVNIEKNNDYLIFSSATINIGYNAEIRLAIEPRNLEDLEEDAGKIEAAVYVQSVADNLRQASAQSPNEVLKYTRELHDFVNEQQLDVSGYEEIESRLEQWTKRLEEKTSRGPVPRKLDEEWVEEIDRTAHRVERLYSRSRSQ